MAAEADVAADSAMVGRFRAVEYRLADGASSPPERADAYEVKPLPAGEVKSKIADALRVDGGLVEVGPGGYDWYYSGVSPDTAVSSSPACAPDEKCEREVAPPPTVPGVPTAAEAEERVREFLAALDASGDGRFEVFGEDGYNRTVVFTPSVGGVPVAGLQTSVSFGRDGRVEYANGLFATVEAIGEYPLVGLEEAVDRLENGFGGGVASVSGVAEDLPAREGGTDEASTGSGTTTDADAGASTGGSSGSAGSAASGGGSSGSTGTGSAEPGVAVAEPTPACAPDEPCTSPPSPPADEPTMTIEPGPTVPLEPEVIEITGAELSLQLVAAGCPGDPVYLVPSFDLQSANGVVGSVTAVEDDAIAGGGSDGDAEEAQPCPDQGPTAVPLGKPEPAPLPADTGREPANP